MEYFLRNELVMSVGIEKLLFDTSDHQSCTENLDNCGWMF